MRLLTGLAIVSLTAGGAMAEWNDYKTIATTPGPAATYGCAAVSEEEAWLCLVLQCDAPGAIGVHFLVAGGADLRGRWPLSVDGRRYVLGEVLQVEGSRFEYTLGTATPEFLGALKAGKEVVLEPPAGRVNTGYDRIPLKKAAAQIARLERVCRAGPRS